MNKLCSREYENIVRTGEGNLKKLTMVDTRWNNGQRRKRDFEKLGLGIFRERGPPVKRRRQTQCANGKRNGREELGIPCRNAMNDLNRKSSYRYQQRSCTHPTTSPGAYMYRTDFRRIILIWFNVVRTVEVCDSLEIPAYFFFFFLNFFSLGWRSSWP